MSEQSKGAGAGLVLGEGGGGGHRRKPLAAGAAALTAVAAVRSSTVTPLYRGALLPSSLSSVVRLEPTLATAVSQGNAPRVHLLALVLL